MGYTSFSLNNAVQANGKGKMDKHKINYS